MSRATLPPYAPVRISIILHQLGWGGVERVAAILANGFAKRKIETELLVCAKGGPGEDELRAIIGENASVHYFRQTQGSRLMDLLKGFTKVGRYLYETKPKIVLSAGNNVSLFSLLLVRLYCPGPTRLFVKTTNPVFRPHDSRFKQFIRRACYSLIFRYCDGVLSLCEEEVSILRKSFPNVSDKFIAVHNPYITDAISPKTTASTDRAKDVPKYLIAVGRLHHQKRFDVLLHAFAKVRNDVDCRLVILGEGEDRTKLQVLSTKLDIAHLIQMPGFVSNVPEWLVRADLFVLSSDYEGLPAVVLEALAFNCPVVATDSFPGARALLEAATRCDVTPIRDADALASAITNSLNKGDSTKELFRITSKYQISAAIDSHIDTLSLLMHQSRAGKFQYQDVSKKLADLIT